MTKPLARRAPARKTACIMWRWALRCMQQGEEKLADVTARLREYCRIRQSYAFHAPLFKNQARVRRFPCPARPVQMCRILNIRQSAATIHIGIDAGSTTVKAVAIDEEGQYRYTPATEPNSGNPVPIIRPTFCRSFIASMPRRPRGKRHGHRLRRRACEKRRSAPISAWWRRWRTLPLRDILCPRWILSSISAGRI